jgi:molybdopterin molybdotransferase
MAELLSVQDAKNRILSNFSPVEVIQTSLESCAGRILGQDIVSDLELPPFANSAMDGYAINSTDLQGASLETPILLQVVEEIPAGSVPKKSILPGQTARIMTGAPIPAGADSVIPVEETRPTNAVSDQGQAVCVLRPTYPGEFIRPRGQDIHQDQLILAKGRKLLPQDIGMLATLGLPIVPVYRKPRLAIFSTGNEIRPPGVKLLPGQIHDSNSYTLAALAEKCGAEVFRLGIGQDEFSEVRQLFDLAITKKADIILTSAGVSVGTFDYVRMLIEAEGKMDFWRVNMRPGKPLAFGTYQNTPVIGLPGNPVSAFVGFEIFVRPVLNRLAGLVDENRVAIKAILAEPVESDGRETYLRGTLTREDDKMVAKLASHQGSGNLFSLVQANVLLRVPPGVKTLPIGAEITAFLIVDEIK